MRQSRTSGSVGAPGRQRPGATRPTKAADEILEKVGRARASLKMCQLDASHH